MNDKPTDQYDVLKQVYEDGFRLGFEQAISLLLKSGRINEKDKEQLMISFDYGMKNPKGLKQ